MFQAVYKDGPAAPQEPWGGESQKIMEKTEISRRCKNRAKAERLMNRGVFLPLVTAQNSTGQNTTERNPLPHLTVFQ